MTTYLVAAALTVAVEVAFYLCVRCRSLDFLVAAGLVNVASNLLLNAALAMLGPENRDWALWTGEAMVIIVEWLVLRTVWERGRPGLLWRVVAANALSLAIGLALAPVFPR